MSLGLVTARPLIEPGEASTSVVVHHSLLDAAPALLAAEQCHSGRTIQAVAIAVNVEHQQLQLLVSRRIDAEVGEHHADEQQLRMLPVSRTD